MQQPVPMAHKLTGFAVRRATPAETPEIIRHFGTSPLAAGTPAVCGAFGQPGDVPLGGVIVQPAGAGEACFQIFVRPECRRNKIGTRLMENLYAEARRHQTPCLHLAAMVHQDLPENAFYRKMGLTPERSFVTYTVSLAKGVLPLCARIAARAKQRHPDLADTQVTTLAQLPAEKIARFFTEHYHAPFDHRVEQLHSGFFDRAISTAVVTDQGEIRAANLYRSRPDTPAIYLDLVLVHPDYRNGPMPMVLFEAMANLAIARGFTDCVFEGDAKHDLFATGFALRCGCKPQWIRYRYAIKL